MTAGAHPIDDAYITFRYARNLAGGLGLVYTPGESVLGTTAPLWALFLGALHRLSGLAIPEIATTASALAERHLRQPRAAALPAGLIGR
jgi:hypothetical protein